MANFEIKSTNKIIMTRLINPPIVDTITAVPNAILASPLFVIAYPSAGVAAAEGVPGIPINIAEIDPPVIPPIYVANNNEIPVTGSIVKVKGSIKANAIEYVNPGMAPNTIPAKAPIEMAIMTSKLPTRLSAIFKFSIKKFDL